MEAVIATYQHVFGLVCAFHVRTCGFTDQLYRFWSEVGYWVVFGWGCDTADVVGAEDEGIYVHIVDNFEIGECFTNCLVKRGYSSGFGLFELGEFWPYFSQLDPDKMAIVYLCVDLSIM